MDATTVIEGPVALLGDMIAGDAILPARHSFLPSAQMAELVLAELGPDVNAEIRRCAILVAGRAFGYGTGRESPARALAAAGVRAIVGGPFARMFYRNAINNGIVVLELPAIVPHVQAGDSLRLLLEQGLLEHRGVAWDILRLEGVVGDIIRHGGLLGYAKAAPKKGSI